jgi:hypothetical protein
MMQKIIRFGIGIVIIISINVTSYGQFYRLLAEKEVQHIKRTEAEADEYYQRAEKKPAIKWFEPQTEEELEKRRREREAGYFEAEVRLAGASFKKFIANISPYGGINYSMNLDDIKKVLTTFFENLKREGKIITQEEYQKLKSTFRYERKLDRIFGAEYLKKKFREKHLDRYDVPDYVIVADNPHELAVTIDFNTLPFPTPRELTNGRIYFKEIKGQGAAYEAYIKRDIGLESGIGFQDFSQPGNIIMEEDPEGKYLPLERKKYIVDIEPKSFEDFDFLVNGAIYLVLQYGRERFKYENQKMLTSGRYTISLSLD